MKQVYDVILGILGDALFQHHYELPSGIEGDTIFQEAQVQSVLPMIYAHIGEDGRVRVSAKWEKLYLKYLANNTKVLFEHAELAEVMGEIPFTTLKGAQSAYYYPNPMNRAMGDVGFIVHEEDLDRAKTALEHAGFKRKGDREHDSHMAFHREHAGTWEMHWKIPGIPNGASGDRVREELKNIIETSTEKYVGKFPCRMLDEFHHCLEMLIHTANHMINTGVGLRHICDWAVFANKVDVSQWEDTLKSCGLWRFAQILTQVSVKYLHLPGQEWAMEDVDPAILEAFILDVFDAGNFGKKDAGRINQAKLMTDSDVGVDNTLMVVHLFREINNKAKIAFPTCKRVVVLRPFAWIYVSVRHLARIRKGMRPKIQVQSMIRGAGKRRELYRTFRLYERKR